MFEDETQEFTPISKLGEFGLIDLITKDVKHYNTTTHKGIGDDAAVLKFGDVCQLVSTDLLVEGVHFDLAYAPLKHLGYKAVVVNLSDICAMNAIPTQITVSLALSNRFPLEAVEELYEGVKLACAHYKVDLIGGDTTSSTSGLMISVTAMGTAKESAITYRSGAQEKDLIVVSGDLGAAYLGLQILEREKAVFMEDKNMQPDLHGSEYVLERQLKPEARMDIVKMFQEMDLVPTSMIDVSDGLSSELLHLAKASNLGLQVYEEKIPCDPTVMTIAEEFKLNGVTCALNGGEDYELLFTVAQKDYDKIKANPNMTVIGYMVDKSSGTNLVSHDAKVFPLAAQGWTAYDKNK
ncbi:thiamine-phosphate kinase [Flavobacteriales bacterium]|nr:thiamine-phosphate kinase [Flavobacteriales bacterium]MDA8945604.1 thiamine-phosphate kinase [Flavobacteriales bacterium]